MSANPKPAEATPGQLVVVTGMTGAGRSTAAKELEDLGFFVVDNLPPQLVAEVVRLVDETHGPRQPVAVVVDVRSGSFFTRLQEVLARGTTGRLTTLLFLEADDATLVRRQEAARRPHPLQEGGRLLDGLRRERVVMGELRADADLVIDTSDLNVHQLTDKVAEAFGTAHTTSLKITVVSFGFKYGIPVDADLVADMRFLPNPHWVPELRPLSGRDDAVADYVRSQPVAATEGDHAQVGARVRRDRCAHLTRARGRGAAGERRGRPRAAAGRSPRSSPRCGACRRCSRSPPT